MRRGWADLSQEERKRGLMILSGVGVGVVVVAVAAFSLTGGDGEAQAAAATPTPTAQGDVTAWFESTTAIWGEVTTAATGVRAFIGTNDGLALQPACAALGTHAAAAEAHPPAPDPGLQELWAGGAASFTDAAQWCAQLWDGTPTAPPVILAEVTGALDAGEESWEELASRVGRPLPELPSGTFAPLDRAPATRAPTATPTPTAAPAASPAPAAPTPTQSSGITLPSVTMPTFDSSSSSAPPPAGTPTG